MSHHRPILYAAVAAGVLIAGWVLRFSFLPDKQVSGQPLPADVLALSEDDLLKRKIAFNSTLPLVPHSFMLDKQTSARFDRFIFKYEGQQPQAIKAFYEQEVAEQYYPFSSANYLVALFNRYVDYKVQLKMLDKPVDVTDITSISKRLQAKRDLQYQLFSDNEYYYLFSDDAAYDGGALARLKIAADKDLSVEQQSELIEQQLLTLPLEQQRSFEPSITVNRLGALERQYENDETRYQAVAAEFGHDVAQRLNRAAHSKAKWQERVKSFRYWREKLIDDGELSTQALQLQITLKRNALFSESEQRRLKVYLENPALFNDA